jgi:hypothetical protein
LYSRVSINVEDESIEVSVAVVSSKVQERVSVVLDLFFTSTFHSINFTFVFQFFSTEKIVHLTAVAASDVSIENSLSSHSLVAFVKIFQFERANFMAVNKELSSLYFIFFRVNSEFSSKIETLQSEKYISALEEASVSICVHSNNSIFFISFELVYSFKSIFTVQVIFCI